MLAHRKYGVDGDNGEAGACRRQQQRCCGGWLPRRVYRQQKIYKMDSIIPAGDRKDPRISPPILLADPAPSACYIHNQIRVISVHARHAPSASCSSLPALLLNIGCPPPMHRCPRLQAWDLTVAPPRFPSLPPTAVPRLGSHHHPVLFSLWQVMQPGPVKRS